MDLAEYAAANAPQGRACSVCALPDEMASQVKTARANHISSRIISKWLTEECGKTVTANMLNSHWQREHWGA